MDTPPSPAHSRLSATSATDVQAWLREQIRHGSVVPGQRLIEADITQETGASRSRVRDAFRRLEAEGLIIIEEFRGASVRRYSGDEIRQLYRARMALEGMAARDFASDGSQSAKEALVTLQAELDIGAAAGDHPNFARANDAWHRVIIEGCGNVHIAAFLDRLRIPVYRLLFTTFYQSERIRMANQGHARITNAIRNGDGQEAEAAMRAHIQEGLEAVSEMVERERGYTQSSRNGT